MIQHQLYYSNNVEKCQYNMPIEQSLFENYMYILLRFSNIDEKSTSFRTSIAILDDITNTSLS